MSLQSIVSYPNRGSYGNNKYRGNTTGKIIKDLIEYFKPKRVLDPMCGSNTTGDVCRDLGIDYTGLDLNPKYGEFDALNDDIPQTSDLIFWHPPYHDIIKYSGKMWGQPDTRDLSRIKDYKDFIKKINKIQAKLISSLKKNGRIAILVGDIKKKGRLYSMQKDMDWLGQPEQVIIKAQHNYQSAGKKYNGRFIPIVHEYLLIFKKDDCYIIPTTMVKRIDYDIRKSKLPTWRDVVQSALEKLNGKATLQQLYDEIQGHAKCKNNSHWKAKIRQVVRQYNDFDVFKRGVYELVA